MMCMNLKLPNIKQRKKGKEKTKGKPLSSAWVRRTVVSHEKYPLGIFYKTPHNSIINFH